MYISDNMCRKSGPSNGNKIKDISLVLHAKGEIFTVKFKVSF